MANGKLLTEVLEIKGIVTEMKVGLSNIAKVVETHEKLIYGEPEKSGEGGMLVNIAKQENKVSGLGKSFDDYKVNHGNKQLRFNTIVNLVVAGVMNWIVTHVHRQ